MLAEITGVELESNYENTVEPALLDDVYPVKDSIEQASAARNILIWASTTSCHIERSKEWMTSFKLTMIVIRKNITMMIAST